MPRCLIGLGSNVGDRAAMLDFAVRRLGEHPHIQLIAHSRWIETRPVGGPAGQRPYLNGAAVIETTMGPDALLDVLQGIEDETGRRREQRWGPRTLDLDLLLYGESVIDTPRLTVPHPRMAFRRFVLEPAAEAAPEMAHPVVGWTIERLWRHLQETPRHVILLGSTATERTRLAAAVCGALPAELCSASSPTLPGGAPVESESGRWVISHGMAPIGDAERALPARLSVIVEPDVPSEADQVLLADLPKQIVGPWIKVSTRHWQVALDEVVAAIEAMSE